MKKQILIALITVIPAIGFARVTDFNDMIRENLEAQTELHAELKNTVQAAHTLTQPRERIVIVEQRPSSYSASTPTDMLAFKKEKSSYRAHEPKQFERLANEIHSANEF